MSSSKKWIVSTDLDGTLLDHTTYSWQAAQPSIETLNARGAIIVLNTSKTYSEVVDLQHELQLKTPFIVENGSAIYFPNDFPIMDSEPYNQTHKRMILGVRSETIVSVLHKIKDQNQWLFSGYSDWRIADIIEQTGLSEHDAQKSANRQFSEPLIWSDSDDNYTLFADQIHQHGFRLLRGGRFIHVLGKVDKGQAILQLKSKLFSASGDAAEDDYQLMCLGDSHNDLAMLQVADYPVMVRSPVHGFPECHLDNPNLYYTQGYGPEGWHEAICKLLPKCDPQSS